MSKDFINEFAALLAQGNEALNRAGEALNMAIEGMPPAGDFQHTYIYQQAMSVASVALDVHLLVSHQRFQNVVGLCRIGFELRISIYAAMRVPEFAVQKYLAGVKSHVEQLEEMIKSGSTLPSFQNELESQRRLLAEASAHQRGSSGLNVRTGRIF